MCNTRQHLKPIHGKLCFEGNLQRWNMLGVQGQYRICGGLYYEHDDDNDDDAAVPFHSAERVEANVYVAEVHG